MAPALFPGAKALPLTAGQVLAGRPHALLGCAVQVYPVVGSTMDLAHEAARAGAPEGLLILAEEQSSGRGRYDRRWQAPAGSSLLASLLLRPTFLSPEQAFLLTALAALGLAEAIEETTGLATSLKWPNDILLQGRKACGILAELEWQGGLLAWAVLGWGLNVNVDFGDSDLAGRAISLAEAAGRPFERLPLLLASLEHLERHYRAIRAGRGTEVWAAWRGRLGMLGRPVRVEGPEGAYTGLALDVAGDGALLVQREGGEIVRVLAGDLLEQTPMEDAHGEKVPPRVTG